MVVVHHVVTVHHAVTVYHTVTLHHAVTEYHTVAVHLVGTFDPVVAMETNPADVVTTSILTPPTARSP